MKRLVDLFNKVIKKHKKLKKWQRIVTVLAAMITFVTTYALILPAITVEKDETDRVSGMYLEEAAELVEEVEDEAPLENALVPLSFVIAADQENAVTYSYEDDDIFAELVISTDEELPEGTELVLNYVDTESDAYADLSSRAKELLSREFIGETTSCSFYDFALICDNVDVTPRTGFADIHIDFKNNTVEHMDDALFAGKFALPLADEGGLLAMSADVTAAQDETTASDEIVAAPEDELSAEEYAAGDELISVNGDGTSVFELSDGIITSLTLKGCDFTVDDSMVGILAGFVDEELKAAAEESDISDAEIPKNVEEEDVTSAPLAGTLTASGKDYTVKLSYDKTSGVPEGAGLEVSEIARDSEEYRTYLEETKKAMGLTEDQTLPQFAARFFDIKILVDGEEFIPESGVTVEIAYTEPLASIPETEVSAVHFQDEESKPEVIDASATEVADDGTATVEFQAESFSVYGVIYTVDYHWKVNGKEFKLSLPGGGYVSLEALMEVFGVAYEDGHRENDSENDKAAEVADASDTEYVLMLNDIEVSEETKEFVAGIEKVEFSDPDLVWVGKVDADTSVGALKKDLGLKIRYSAKLTEEQIEEINAQTVKAGDWALISILPFETKECLTVTMKTGEIFTIKVTDAMDPLGIDDRTVSFVYLTTAPNNNGQASGYAIDYSGNTISRKSVDYLKKNGVEYCSNGTKVWLFEYIADETDPNYGKYYISNGYHSDETVGKYLTFKNGSLELITGKSNADPVSISRVDGTDYYRIGDDTTGYISWNGSTFVKGTANDNINLNFCLTESSGTNASHKATLTSVQEIKPGQDVIIYRRVQQPDYTYKYYAIDGNGNAKRVYDNSDSIYWKGDEPVEWEIRDLGGYYAFYNPTTKTYLALQQTGHAVLAESAYTGDEQDIRISMPGKIAGTYTSKLSYWYADGNVTNGLKVTENDEHTGATVSVVPMDESDEFYFAVRDPAVQGELTEVDTLDSDSMGIKITMYDFSGAAETTTPSGMSYLPKRLKFMDAIMGNEAWTQGQYTPGFVSRYLDSDGYPVIISNANNKRYWSNNSVVNNSLKLLFENETVQNGDPKKGTVTKTEDVNHLFLQNVYDSSGYFHYSCFENAAYLNGNNFEVYEQLASSSADDNVYTRRGNFWPYDQPDPTKGHKFNNYDPDLLQYGSAQDPYGTTSNSSNFPRAGEDVYYVNANNTTDPNCYFGMILEAKFTQNENGFSDRGDPVIFYFNGDDDMWVYADKVLLLDLGGVHDAFRGKINFHTGEITVTSPTKYKLDNVGNQTDQFDSYGTIVEKTYIKEQYYQAGKLPNGEDWPTENGVKLKKSPIIDRFFTDGGETSDGKLIGTYKDYSTHDLKMFYMERGAGASQLELTFNLPVLRESSFRVKKEMLETASSQIVQDEYANVPFYYEVYKGTDTNRNGVIDDEELIKCKRSDFIDPSTQKMTAKYDDEDRTDLEWATDDGNETKFLLRTGQTAIFPAENDGVYWYVVEVEPDDESRTLNQYEVTNSDPDKTIDGDPNNPTVEDQSNPGTYTGTYTNWKYTRYLTTEVKTIKERNFVTYRNYPDDSLVNELQIKKRITGRPYSDETKNTFEYRILLEATDGTLFVYREGDYYQTDKNGNYVYFDTYVNSNGRTVTERRLAVKELHDGKVQYKYTYHTNATNERDEWVDEPKPTEKTSPKGSLGNILDGDTITIKGLIEGTRFYVYERTAGYSNMAESETPVDGKYIVDGVPIVTDADSWTEAENTGLEAELEYNCKFASFSVSDYEKAHAAKGTIQHHEEVNHQDAKVLIKNKPYSELDFSVKKNWYGMDDTDSSLENSKIKITLGRYVLKDEAGTLNIKKEGVPAGTNFYARYVIKKITEEQPEGEEYKVIYYNQNMADGNGVAVSVDPGTYTVTEQIIYQDNVGYTWYHSYELADGQEGSSGNGDIIITTNEIDDNSSDTVTFKCEPLPTMNTGNLRVISTLDDGNSGVNFSDVYYIVYAGDQNSTTRATYPNGKKVPVITYSEASQTNGYLISGLKAGTYTVREYKVPDSYGTHERDVETSTNHSQTVAVPGAGTQIVEFINNYGGNTKIGYSISQPWTSGASISGESAEFPVGSQVKMTFYASATWDKIDNLYGDWVGPHIKYGDSYLSHTRTTSGQNSKYEITFEVKDNTDLEIWINANPTRSNEFWGLTFELVNRSRSSMRSAARTLNSAGRKNAVSDGLRGDPDPDDPESGDSEPNIIVIEDTGELPVAPEGKKYIDDPTFTMANPDYDPENPEETGPEIIDYTIILDQEAEWTWDTITDTHYFPATDEDGDPYYYYIKSVEEIDIPDRIMSVVKVDVGEDDEGEEVDYQFLVGGQDQHYDAEHGVYEPLEVDNTLLTDLEVEKQWIDEEPLNSHDAIRYKIYRIPYRIVVNPDYDPEETDPESPNFSQTKRINYPVEEVVKTEQDSMDGKVLVPSMEGYTGILQYDGEDEEKNWKEKVTDLPTGGSYLPANAEEAVKVLYEYYVSEISDVTGYKHSITGGLTTNDDNEEEYQFTIKNEPISATDKFTQIDIQKEWLDAMGNPEDGFNLHKNDVIEFEVKQTRYKAMAAIGDDPPVDTELYPITINLVDENGVAGSARVTDTIVVYVPKGAEFKIEPIYHDTIHGDTYHESEHVVSVGGIPVTNGVSPRDITRYSNGAPSSTFYYPNNPQVSFTFENVNEAKEVTLWLYAGGDQWVYLYDNNDPTNYLQKTEPTHPEPDYHAWTCQLYCDKEVIWDLQEVYYHIVKEQDAYSLEGANAAVSTNYKYEMKLEKKEGSDEYTTKIKPEVNAPGTGVPDPETFWKGSIINLPLYEYVKEDDNNTYIYTYEIVEKTINSAEIKPASPPVTLGEGDDAITYNYQSSSYYVSWPDTEFDATQPTSLKFTNRKLPVIKASLHKVDKDNLDENTFIPLPGAEFMLVKYDLVNGAWVKDTNWEDQGEKKPITEDSPGSGIFDLGSLTEGYYAIVETKYPAGYIQAAENPMFRVKMDTDSGEMMAVLVRASNPNIGAEIGSGSTDMVKLGNEADNNGTTTWIVTVGNQRGAALPSTGGPGTKIYTVLGAMLAVTSGLLLVIRRRRRTS